MKYLSCIFAVFLLSGCQAVNDASQHGLNALRSLNCGMGSQSSCSALERAKAEEQARLQAESMTHTAGQPDRADSKATSPQTTKENRVRKPAQRTKTQTPQKAAGTAAAKPQPPVVTKPAPEGKTPQDAPQKPEKPKVNMSDALKGLDV